MAGMLRTWRLWLESQMADATGGLVRELALWLPWLIIAAVVLVLVGLFIAAHWAPPPDWRDRP